MHAKYIEHPVTAVIMVIGVFMSYLAAAADRVGVLATQDVPRFFDNPNIPSTSGNGAMSLMGAALATLAVSAPGIIKIITDLIHKVRGVQREEGKLDRDGLQEEAEEARLEAIAAKAEARKLQLDLDYFKASQKLKDEDGENQRAALALRNIQLTKEISDLRHKVNNVAQDIVNAKAIATISAVKADSTKAQVEDNKQTVVDHEHRLENLENQVIPKPLPGPPT